MAYQCRIIWAALNFEESAYDACYRRQACRLRSLNCSVEDMTLAQEAFVGRARVVSRCCFYLGHTHSLVECPLAPEHEKPAESKHPPSLKQDIGPPWHTKRNLCGLYNSANGDHCYFIFCKFEQRCWECGQMHPVSACPGQRAQPEDKCPPSLRGQKRPAK